MRWYWWLWVLLMWWMLFSCGDPAVYVVEEKPSYPKMGSGSQRSGEAGVRSMGAEKSSRGSGERDSDDNRRDND